MAENAFGLRLKELRESAGLTQPALAEKSGASVRMISRLETGVQEATWPVVQSLAAALGVDCRAFQEPPSANVKPAGRGRPKSADSAPPAKRKGRTS